MSSGAIIGFSCIALLILLFLKVPVYGAILGSTIIYFVLQPDVTIYLIIQRMIAGIESIPLLAVPFFIAAGVFMNYTGVTKRIMDFCTVLTCKLPGGLAQVNVLLSTMMGGLSGSSLADAAMEAKMLEPEMERHGYSKPFSSAVTAFSSIITPLIPPGIAAILYGSIANLSIGKLFIAGIGPGLLLCTSMMLLCGIISKKRGYQAYGQARMDKKELGTKFRHAILPLCLPVIIIGGIRLGICTPTEAGSIAVVYSIILGVLYRELGWGELKKGLKESVLTTASVLIIVSAASAFSWILTREQIPQKLTALMTTYIGGKYAFLVIVNVFLLFVGMFIEGNAALIVLVPLLHPMAVAFGVDPIQFALIFNFNMAIGAVTPPMGTLMFTVCGITKCKMKDFIIAGLQFYALALGCLALLTFVPVFTLGIVNLVF